MGVGPIRAARCGRAEEGASATAGRTEHLRPGKRGEASALTAALLGGSAPSAPPVPPLIMSGGEKRDGYRQFSR